MAWEVLSEEEGLRLDRAVPAHVGEASRTQAQRWIGQGRVRVGGRQARASHLLRAGERVEVDIPPPEPAGLAAEAIPLDIVYEDSDLVVLNKPSGMVVHPAAGQRSGTLVNALLHHCPSLSGIGGVSRPGIVHRLDRGTSGLLVVAKQDQAHRALASQFARRSVEKRYLALVYGLSSPHLRIEKPIGRDRHDRKKISSRSRRAKPALTEAERVEELPCSTLLSVRIATGRTHQVRVHLAEAGHPVVGDKVYGRAQRPPRGGEAAFRILRSLARPALHAARLGFRHPRSGDWMSFEAPLPADFQSALDRLRALRASQK